MAIALQAQAVNTTGANATGTITINSVQTGELLIACLAIRSGTAINSVTDPTHGAWSLAVSNSDGSTFSAIYYVASATAGNHTVSINLAGADTTYANVSRWTGHNASSPLDQTNSQDVTGATSYPHGSVTTTSNAGLIVTAACQGGALTETVNAAFTELTNNGGRDYFQYRIISGAVTTDGAYTAGTGGHAGVIASFLQAGGGGGAVKRNNLALCGVGR